jgi:hypothetical protein
MNCGGNARPGWQLHEPDCAGFCYTCGFTGGFGTLTKKILVRLFKALSGVLPGVLLATACGRALCTQIRKETAHLTCFRLCYINITVYTEPRTAKHSSFSYKPLQHEHTFSNVPPTIMNWPSALIAVCSAWRAPNGSSTRPPGQA